MGTQSFVIVKFVIPQDVLKVFNNPYEPLRIFIRFTNYSKNSLTFCNADSAGRYREHPLNDFFNNTTTKQNLNDCGKYYANEALMPTIRPRAFKNK